MTMQSDDRRIAVSGRRKISFSDETAWSHWRKALRPIAGWSAGLPFLGPSANGKGQLMISTELKPIELNTLISRPEGYSVPKPIAEKSRRGSAVSKFRAAKTEAEHLFRIAESWPERLAIARLMAGMYVARALPMNTYSWDAAVRLHGATYCVGLRTSEIYVIEEVYRYKMYDLHADFVPKEDWVVFDIGANIGVVSVLQARRKAQVYAFEPNPDCYRRLLKNVTGNRLADRIRPFNLALSNSAGVGTMQVERGGTTGGTVLAGEQAGQSAARVSITTLDRIVPALNVSRIDLLKIDVEGAEVEVLLGAVRTLEVTQRIVLEYHSRRLLKEAQDILTRSGFVRRERIVYYPEDSASQQEEVGITYYARPEESPS